MAEKPKDLMSKRHYNKVERMSSSSFARVDDTQNLAFSPRDFVLCGLPYKRVSGGVYERRNGDFVFNVVTNPEVGVPYGQDRLLPIWLSSAFKILGQPEDNSIWFRSGIDILRAFSLPIGGDHLNRLVKRIMRIFEATFGSYNVNDPEFKKAEKFRIIKRIEIWIDRKAPTNQHTLWRNRIVLTQEFADDLREASIPVDLNSIVALKDRPMAMDLYIWQAWRSFRLTKSAHKEVAVPFFGTSGLAFQLGSNVAKEKHFRQQLKHAQSVIKAFWPECPNYIKGDALIIRPGLAVNPKSKLYLPGVSEAPSRYPNPLGPDHPDILVIKRAKPNSD